ncbi:MAG: 3-hydroxy-3-methylglutaryl-CoA reductase [Acidobacteria bacterium]|nr:3-hydroxy-3-methylglutaryl-CoA reductase [Acidobacteriota bacterium]
MNDLDATHDDLVRELAEGKRRFHALPDSLNATERAAVRRAALAQRFGADLTKTGEYTLDAEAAADRHCENMIGATQIPVGVVGPLSVRGDYADGDFYVPLATTEGALVASINRGANAITAAGGASVHVEDVGMTRAPVFKTSGLAETREFLAWVVANEDAMREVAEATSRYLRLLDVKTYAIGTTVFVRFRFSSGDAMGMNMATIACDRVVHELVEVQTGVQCIALSGNYCVDKKPAAVNFQHGRGKRVQAEVVLDASVLRKLKTNAADLVEVQYRKNLLGSIAAGATGYNAHFANVLAAFFLATGQDPAHVAEASMGVTTIEAHGDDGVIVSVFLPDTPIAAVGGGTTLDTQREALAILGVKADPERPGVAALRLAEILGATVLAGELSLMAAFTSKDLAGAHERLGRSAQS